MAARLVKWSRLGLVRRQQGPNQGRKTFGDMGLTIRKHGSMHEGDRNMQSIHVK